MRRRSKVAIVAVAVILVFIFLVPVTQVWFAFPYTPSSPRISVSSTTAISNTCIFPGQSMGFFLRVLSDSNSGPIAGASVAGSYEFAYTCSTPQLTTSLTIQQFTTNNTEWYQFSGINDGLYTLTVTNSNRIYDLTASGRPSVYTCATLYLPSGNTSVVYQPTFCEGASTPTG